jgi:hypothetical protein
MNKRYQHVTGYHRADVAAGLTPERGDVVGVEGGAGGGELGWTSG